ncbi:hypothetical protein MA16_Dca010987 [Dendrobium catenatum]|uniref:DUF4283 domain-containing protein n=1 Tax=Dendrobium catenatum TaxID=906689 RepID=A0A2I0WVR7_9ASPA|nr:hypothetical protein MA16_Dca010987 [Dendrobium catenatum]
MDFFFESIVTFFNPKVLHALGSIFGYPLQIDQATAIRTRPSVARVLVEVDISKKHAKEIWVGSKAYGYLQRVELEKVSYFCSHCKIHGHATSECFKLHSDLKGTPISTVEKSDLPKKTPINLEDDLPASPINNIRNIVKLITILMKNRDIVINKNMSDSADVAIEGDKELNIYVSIDSMLHNTNVNQLLIPHMNIVSIIELETIDKDVCEEGEFIPKSGMEVLKEDQLESDEKEDSMSSNFLGTTSNKNEEDDFIKVNRKKGKNVKSSFPSTPRCSRAHTSTKGCNV